MRAAHLLHGPGSSPMHQVLGTQARMHHWSQVIDAAGLVPGDVCLIAIGNIIPADVKLLGDEEGEDPIQV